MKNEDLENMFSERRALKTELEWGPDKWAFEYSLSSPEELERCRSYFIEGNKAIWTEKEPIKTNPKTSFKKGLMLCKGWTCDREGRFYVTEVMRVVPCKGTIFASFDEGKDRGRLAMEEYRPRHETLFVKLKDENDFRSRSRQGNWVRSRTSVNFERNAREGLYYVMDEKMIELFNLYKERKKENDSPQDLKRENIASITDIFGLGYSQIIGFIPALKAILPEEFHCSDNPWVASARNIYTSGPSEDEGKGWRYKISKDLRLKAFGSFQRLGLKSQVEYHSRNADLGGWMLSTILKRLPPRIEREEDYDGPKPWLAPNRI